MPEDGQTPNPKSHERCLYACQHFGILYVYAIGPSGRLLISVPENEVEFEELRMPSSTIIAASSEMMVPLDSELGERLVKAFRDGNTTEIDVVLAEVAHLLRSPTRFDVDVALASFHPMVGPAV